MLTSPGWWILIKNIPENIFPSVVAYESSAISAKGTAQNEIYCYQWIIYGYKNICRATESTEKEESADGFAQIFYFASDVARPWNVFYPERRRKLLVKCNFLLLISHFQGINNSTAAFCATPEIPTKSSCELKTKLNGKHWNVSLGTGESFLDIYSKYFVVWICLILFLGTLTKRSVPPIRFDFRGMRLTSHGASMSRKSSTIFAGENHFDL